MRLRNRTLPYRALFLAAFLAPTAVTVRAPAAEQKNIADLQARAERGFASKQLELGYAYLSGRGVSRDLKKAAYWYERAAKAGDPVAENEIGYLYQHGIGVKADKERAVHWYQLSSASGLPMGKINLAICYLKGTGVRKNESTARKLFEEAVEKGDGLGAAYLGDMELLGLDGPVNQDAAERWFETGTRLHDPVAANNLAYLYSVLTTHAHDFDKAARLLRFSAGKGYVPAMHSLGLLFVNHPEIPHSPGEPRTLLEGASAAGYWRSSAVLGVLARDGRGMPLDPAQAFYFFHLARLQGGDTSAQVVALDLRLLSRTLTPEQQSTSAARAESWFESHRSPMPREFLEDGQLHPGDSVASAHVM